MRQALFVLYKILRYSNSVLKVSMHVVVDKDVDSACG